MIIKNKDKIKELKKIIQKKFNKEMLFQTVYFDYNNKIYSYSDNIKQFEYISNIE